MIADYVALRGLTVSQEGATIRVPDFHSAVQINYSSTRVHNLRMRARAAMLVSQKSGKRDWRKPASPRLCNRDRPLYSSAREFFHPIRKYLIKRTSQKLQVRRTKNRKMSYFPPTPNYPGDNNNSFNTTGSLNHNSDAQNHNNNAFNRNSLSYTYHISVTINNTSNEIEEERSAIEIARRIPETLSPP